MAYSRAVFNTESLVILNMLDFGETINYDWTVNEDFSIVLMEGSIQLHDGTTLNELKEYRVQPNTRLTARALSSGRTYFITLFKISRDSLVNQLVTESNKTRMKTFAPTWYDSCLPTNPKTTWGNEFVSGNYTYTKTIMNTQISNSEWD